MSSVLFIAYEFPPLNSGGMHRSLKLVRYLPEHGVRPVVLTATPGSYQLGPGEALDPVLLEQLPPGVPIHRVPVSPPRRLDPLRNSFYINLVDAVGRRWKDELLRTAVRLKQQEDLSALYVTVPPFSLAPVAVELSQATGLPLVLDLRDAWSQWNVAPFASWAHYQLLLRLERRCLDAAAAVVVTSDQTLADLARLHPKIAPKLKLITNGFDAPLPELAPGRVHQAGRPWTIGYVGSFYYEPRSRELMFRKWWRKRPYQMLQYSPRREDWLYRSPYFFFRALASLFQRRPELRERVRVRFVGSKPRWMDAMLEETGVAGSCEHLGRKTHSEALAFQRECDALLVTSSKVVGGADYSIAGKTFEYLAQLKPIIAFSTPGAQRRLLGRTGMAMLCDPDDPVDSAGKLEAWLEGRVSFAPERAFLSSLHARALAGQMAGVLVESGG